MVGHRSGVVSEVEAISPEEGEAAGVEPKPFFFPTACVNDTVWIEDGRTVGLLLDKRISPISFTWFKSLISTALILLNLISLIYIYTYLVKYYV